MVQLNLSGKQPNHTQQKSPAESKGGSITNQTVGALGALAMFAAVIVIGSCSRSSKPVAVQQPMQPATPVSTSGHKCSNPDSAGRTGESQTADSPRSHAFLRQPGVRSIVQFSAAVQFEVTR